MMQFTNEEKKSMAITTAVVGVLLMILIFIRFANSVDISELAGGGGGGVEINFGDSDLGMGPDFTSEVLNVTEANKKSAAAREPEVEEEILAQENTRDVRDYTVVKKTTTTKDKPKTITKPVKEQPKTRQVSDFVKNAASSLNGNKSGGDGDDGVAGNKGRKDGSLNSSNYYGDGGSGGGTGGGHGTGNGSGIGAGSGSGTGGGNGYSLSGRKATLTPKPQSNCNEAGTIVISVTVDRNGNVVNAKPLLKGSSTSSTCLRNAAIKAAKATKWEPKASASAEQIGSIVYNFKLN